MAPSYDAIHPVLLEPIIRRALEEDWGYRDWTTDLCVSAERQATAKIYAKESLILAGQQVAKFVFLQVDPSLVVESIVSDGSPVNKGDCFLTINGSARSILKAERVALNFLGRMCGIASNTHLFVQKLRGTKTQLLDTRKSTPGLRLIEKYATSVGGARNHRIGLSDGVLVKENHIRAAGSITQALAELRESLPPTLKIEVETSNLNEVQEALAAGADIIMLDNMPLAEMTLAVRTIRGRALVEASGNITLETLRSVADTGVDFISSGAIMHSSRWSDLSLLFDLSPQV